MKEAESVQSTTNGIFGILSIVRLITVDMVSVFKLEARLFRCTALAMFKLCVVIGLLLVAGWLFLGAAVAVALESLQAINLIGALALVALFNLIVSALLIGWLTSMVRDLTFHESRDSVDTLLAHARSVVNDSGQEQHQT